MEMSNEILTAHQNWTHYWSFCIRLHISWYFFDHF